MRTSLLIVAATLAAACGSSGFDIRKPSCDADVATLSRGLTLHLVNGNGDGSFSYAPTGTKLAAISGSYDLGTGDFSWTETGGRDSYIDDIEVEGFGYADENGDLDIIGTRTRTDVKGETDEVQFRTERIGCSVRNRLRYTVDREERELDERGTYLAGVYEYSSAVPVDGAPYETDGQRYIDGTYSETISYDTPGYRRSAERSGDVTTDTSTLTYDDVIETDSNGTLRRTGTDESFTDGSIARAYTLEYPDRTIEWDYRYDYDGNGGGTILINGTTECSVTFTEFSCRYDCGRAGAGDC